ncbi:MAG: hypothetical protein V4665_00150 [Patescibacteria group bacterium]
MTKTEEIIFNKKECIKKIIAQLEKKIIPDHELNKGASEYMSSIGRKEPEVGETKTLAILSQNAKRRKGIIFNLRKLAESPVLQEPYKKVSLGAIVTVSNHQGTDFHFFCMLGEETPMKIQVSNGTEILVLPPSSELGKRLDGQKVGSEINSLTIKNIV